MFNNKSNTEDAVIEISKIVSDIAGIQLGEKQYSMVESRLKSRMLKLNIDTTQEYLAYVKKNKESETGVLLSLLTTHHTYFFREFSHFEHILNNRLKILIKEAEQRSDKKIRIWSAACSSGQEAYSIAMFFDFHLRSIAPHIDFEIWGTDIDKESVQIAQNGVYKSSDLHQSPAMYVGNHWVQGKNNVKDYSKAKDTIKNKCKFSTLNLMKVQEFSVPGKFDLIFCRNVFIYFNLQQIEKITSELIERLSPVGSLILGVSESLLGLKLPVETTGPSIYQKIGTQKVQEAPVPKQMFIEETKPLNVLCVDDSKTIHALLKNVLTLEHGFIIKNKAMNGEEALKLLKTETYDAITLDLHMPIVDGLGFLSKRTDKTPVIILSSINREDESIAKAAIKLGALDYVEKPTIENLINSGNEIRAKIKSVIKNTKSNGIERSAKVESPRKPDFAIKTESVSKIESAIKMDLKSDIKPEAVKKIKTLIVDDSDTIRDLLAKIISSDSSFEVIGKAKDAFEAEKMMNQTKPDLITLDIHMPGKTGVEFLKEFQSKQFIPTVMISALSHEDGPFVMDALAAGAIDYIKKPEFKDLAKLTPIIHERLKNAAKAKKAKSRAGQRKVLASGEIDREHVVLIGASTGGTEALRSLLETLPKEIPPILIVQHIPEVFSKAFADRLNSLMPFEVKEAEHNEVVTPNKVLVAPGGRQMGIKVSGDKIFIQITDDPLVNRHRPSVDYLFKSAYEAQLRNSTAAVLTGMGSDGSKELMKLKSIGVRTIAQDEATSVIYGMPKAAAATGAVDFILPLDQIGEKIMQLAEKKRIKKSG